MGLIKVMAIWLIDQLIKLIDYVLKKMDDPHAPTIGSAPIARCYHAMSVFRENERRGIERRKAQEELK